MIIAIEIILTIMSLLILARVLMSWVQVDPYHPVVQFIYNTTEPILQPIRQLLPPMGGFDLSPMVAMIGLSLLGSLLASALA
jgi:YggT family protein